MDKFWTRLGRTLGLLLLLWGSFGGRAIAAPSSLEDAIHLLNRISFGPTASEIQQVQTIGIDRYLEQQLNPSGGVKSPQLRKQLAEFQTLKLNSVQLNQQFRPPLKQGQEKPVKPNQAFARKVLEEATEARIQSALKSPDQLQEVMVAFWFNHFNVYSGKDRTKVWVGSYEWEAIRPYALGHFRELLGATARHPAMLFYLDNWRNTDPKSAGAKGQFKGLNENYARELMELHTLGVEGGYQQSDVMALAQILTGWSLQMNADPSQQQTNFKFVPQRHDFSNKVLLGQTLKGSGQAEVEQALDILAQHPATARHISYKLAQYFVADQPPQPLVDRLTQTFQSSQGDIRAVLNTLFHDPVFWDTPYRWSKFKTPYQFVLATLRQSETDPQNFKLLQNTLRQLGMPIYGCPTPDGYANTQRAWLNPDGLARRLDFVTVLMRQQPPKAGSERLLQQFSSVLSPQSQTAIQSAPPHLRAALILGSPEMMWR